jgi:cytochrome c-type biogenesis protein CcmH
MLPKDADLRVDFANAEFLASDRKWTKAATDATDVALALKPDHPEALWLAGTQRFVKKDYAAAVRFWEKLLKVAPANFDHAHDLATSLVEARARRDGKDPAAALAAAGIGVSRPLPAAGPSLAGAPADDKAALARELHATLSAMGGAPPVAVNTAPGKHVTGEVTLQPALRSQVARDATIFIFARADGGDKPAMPLAAKRYRVADLPIRFDLSDDDAMSPQFTLSSASRVVIVARISKTGDARAQAGDFEGTSHAVAVGSGGITVVIDTPR